MGIPEELPESRRFEDFVICPWCGASNGAETYSQCKETCSKCGKEYFVEVNYETTYCTYPVSSENDNQ